MAEQEAEAALALTRWEELQRADTQQPGGERRFRRRAFERARDRALQALAMRLKPPMLGKRATPAGGGRMRRRRGSLSRRAVL